MFNSSRSGSLRLFFVVVYDRDLHSGQARFITMRSSFLANSYSRIFVKTPAPTVRLPSRMAKCKPSSMATG